jgi:hypothetical protein
MYQTREGGPKIIIIAMAILFGFLLLIFLYYLWDVKFGDSKTIEQPDPLTSSDVQTIVRANVPVNNGLDNDELPAKHNVLRPNEQNNILPPNPSDPDYVPLGFKKKPGSKSKKQVFNVSNNIYTYNDAKAVCKAFGSDLATYPQIVNAYKKGASWCNYGWTDGQLALYPTQKKQWLRLQDEDPERRDDCGKVGINGGYFENPDQLFGVNCFGIKPIPRAHEKMKLTNKTAKEYELEKQISKIKKNIDNLSILPFNKDKWSNCSA